METIKGYILLIRPLNQLIAFIAIFIGGFVTGTIRPLSHLILASLSGTLISAGGCSINDYYDVEIDRINKPTRPLPAGLVSQKQAYILSMILFSIGIILSFFIHFIGFLIALISSILVYLYSFRLKGTVLWGNLTVAFLTGLAFVYGGLAVGRTGKAFIVGIFAFFYHWAREIIKDIEDVKGDRSTGIETLPIRYGVKAALFWATGIITFLIGLTTVPYFINLFSVKYLVAVVVGVDFFLVYVLASMWQRPEPENLGKLARMMKVDMFIGLLAVYIGR